MTENIISPKQGPEIALAHDWLVGLRGGERVLDRLARLFGPTTIYTLVDDRRFLTEAIAQCRIVTSPLQRCPGASGRARRWYLPLMPWAVGQLRVDRCDLLISTSSAVMQAVTPPPGVPHLCYCHSPARYIWEQGHDYALGAGGRVRAAGLGLVRSPFQRWDRAKSSGVTRFIANSRHTAERIERCYRRNAGVVYPPVRVDSFPLDQSVQREQWLLVVAALEPYKRVDLVINAANQARLPLRIVGTGSQQHRLAAMAGSTVDMLGHVDDAELCQLLQRAKAAVFPQVEDFGIAMVEAQAAGCPVVAFAGGGALDIVTIDTGELFDTQSTHALLAAIERLSQRVIEPTACRANAMRFQEKAFDAAILGQVSELLGAKAVGDQATASTSGD
jgi:glycosyltransferase involved in cell wall biosynthesis